jgi:hypothetical protein
MDPETDIHPNGSELRLRALLRQRHWQTYRTFKAEYDRAAKAVDPRLIGSWPSRPQYHRWISGQLKGLPYADHNRVLERMLPGWTAAELFDRCPLGAPGEPQVSSLGAGEDGPVGSGLRLVVGYEPLQAALMDVVEGARESLAITGSRSREPRYLAAVEAAVIGTHHLEHHRVLYGPPRTVALKEHLLRLFDGGARVRLGMVEDLYAETERFICASEVAAVIVLPSLTSTGNYDTGLVVSDPVAAGRYVDHVRQAYIGSRHMNSRAAVSALDVLR